ncbi:ABC transporter permease [Kaistia algarum]|uniref:ABC transporter permease n=1 Tax=Kaistia algarum TaxID=2083279 RepID=UPI000CE83BB6|nr:ABC transporter permease [Kaistia algarum]MCX5515501.1 ABC transporter permease [Kaistia algarum]PPE81095.1 ABC transporter permease [Kaistia algarum]
MNGQILSPKMLRSLLPALSLAALLAAIFYLQPRAMSYVGFNLMLNLAIPIAFATIAQMCVITVNDLDLSIGTYVGFVACVGATLLSGGMEALPFVKELQASGTLPAELPWIFTTPIAGIIVLLFGIAVYALLGALIYWRDLPSIVVTLGMSFVWLGLSVLILPVPGGQAPTWIRSLMTLKPLYIPFPIIAVAVIAISAHFLVMRTSYGAVLRGAGGNPRAIERAGWSLLRVKMTMFALAGFFGMLAGLSLIGLTTSGDANIALRYTLLSIAGVILGGGEFVGGRISPVGAVIGAVTLTLAGSFLSFLRISPDWQIGAQGAILILVLALRALIDHAEKRK